MCGFAGLRPAGAGLKAPYRIGDVLREVLIRLPDHQLRLADPPGVLAGPGAASTYGGPVPRRMAVMEHPVES